MSRPLDENEIGRLLREGLQAQPVPQPGPDFDSRVLAALRSQRPWWRSLWISMRPVVTTAACSMVIMLVILHWSLQSPMASSPNYPAPNAAPTASQAGVTMAMLDKALDRPDLRFGTFALFLKRSRPVETTEPRPHPPNDTPGRPPEPHRRDGLLPHREALLA